MGRPANPAKDAVYLDDVACIRETEKAILVQLTDGAETWIPKSVLHDDSEVYKLHDSGTLAVAEWFAKREGWA